MREGPRLFGKSEHVQRIQGKGGIAQPREAIVPVALPTHIFRQRSSGSSNNGTRRRIRHHLEGKRASLYLFNVWTTVCAPLEPLTPTMQCMSQLEVKVALLQFKLHKPASS